MRNFYTSKPIHWAKALCMATFLGLATTAAAQGTAPLKPSNLKATADFSLVELTWERGIESDTLLSESFEGETFPPAGWTVKTTNTADAINTWFHYPTDDFKMLDNYTDWIHTGTRSACVYMDTTAPHEDGTPSTQDEWLILPATTGARYLNFYCFIDPKVLINGQYEEYGDHYCVEVSHDGGTTWKTLWDARYDSNGSDSFQLVSLYLGDPSEGDPIVAFHAQSNEKNADESLYGAWVIDDVVLLDDQADADGEATTAAEYYIVTLDDVELSDHVTSLCYTDTTIKESGDHVYGVQAIGPDGSESQIATATVSIKIPSTAAPKNVKLGSKLDEATGKYEITVTWEAPDGDRKPAYYNVYCNNALVGGYLEDLGVGQTGIPKGVYEYVVEAVYETPDGTSERVGDVIAVGTRNPARHLSATRNANGSLTLDWEAPHASDYAVEKYQVYRGDKLLGETTDTTYTEQKAVNGIYEYAVKTVYADGGQTLPATVSVEYGDDVAYELPFTETFDSGLMPENWSQEKLRTGLKDNYMWRFDNWYDLPVSGSGFEGGFASINTSAAGYTRVTAVLYSPLIINNTLRAGESTYLSFDMDFYSTAKNDKAEVDYSFDGENWETLEAFTGYSTLGGDSTCAPVHKVYDISNLFANTTGPICFAWAYNCVGSKHLAIDNVKVYNADPAAIASAKVAPTMTYSLNEGLLTVNANGIERVEAYAADGRKLTEASASASNSLTLPLTAKGIKLVRVTTKDGVKTIKLK